MARQAGDDVSERFTDELWREAQSAASGPRAQAIASAALTRLFNYAQGAAR